AGDETAFLFERDGRVLGIGRRRGTAQLLRSAPPYNRWDRRDLEHHLGGPLVAKWGGRTVVGGRRQTGTGPKTSMSWLLGGKLHEFAELPSGGDNS
ncbi:MAG: exo-alpha-sialidase, partial [Akkermansiaceae bacterium]|nr:exo-alpha-sialidase [Akkermansiaceae bacterium]